MVFAYREFPRPGVVVGDQIATGVVLARRLGYAFVYYRPQLARLLAGPWAMSQLGRIVRPLLYVLDDRGGREL